MEVAGVNESAPFFTTIHLAYRPPLARWGRWTAVPAKFPPDIGSDGAGEMPQRPSLDEWAFLALIAVNSIARIESGASRRSPPYLWQDLENRRG